MKNTILYLPEGAHDIFVSVNGQPGERKVLVTAACVPLLQRDLDAKIAAGKARQAARPCGYFDHRTGPPPTTPCALSGHRGAGCCSMGRDYAGCIYNRFTRVTDKHGYETTIADTKEGPLGAEMPTVHLEKITLDNADFLRYWNDRKQNKYVWRECFMKCLKLIFQA